jgi:hypothetical protein
MQLDHTHEKPSSTVQESLLLNIFLRFKVPLAASFVRVQLVNNSSLSWHQLQMVLVNTQSQQEGATSTSPRQVCVLSSCRCAPSRKRSPGTLTRAGDATDILPCKGDADSSRQSSPRICRPSAPLIKEYMTLGSIVAQYIGIFAFSTITLGTVSRSGI